MSWSSIFDFRDGGKKCRGRGRLIGEAGCCGEGGYMGREQDAGVMKRKKKKKKKGRRHQPLFGRPTTKFHALLNSRPDTLNDLTITPATTALDTVLLIPALNSKVLHTPTPALDLARDVLASPPDIDAGG